MTLARCLESLLRQARSDVELLLINDGSPDKCDEICRNYAERFSNIRYFQKENGGVSSARNLGLEKAMGEYVLFVDSDDYVSESLFSFLDRTIADCDSDLTIFSYYSVNGQQLESRLRKPVIAANRAQTMPEIVNAMCKRTINQPWAKLYKRSIIEQNKITFPIGISVGEDRAFNIKYSLYINSFRVSDQPLYYVCIENAESLSRKQRDDLDEQMAAQLRFIEDAFRNKNIPAAEQQAYRETISFDLLRTVYTKAKYLRRSDMEFFARIRELRTLCGEINAHGWAYPKTRYCRLISLPVRWKLAIVIDVMAWKLTH